MPFHTPRPAPAVRAYTPATHLLEDKDHCHPKWCPAHLSVCLRPAPTASTLHPRHSPPRDDRGSGRERKSAILELPADGSADWMRRRHNIDVPDNPSKWFEDSNRNVSCNHSGLFVDEDLPFYINEPSRSDDDSACAVPSDFSNNQQPLPRHGRSPRRSISPRMDSSGSKSDDFRSVIDDLTVENKRLRRKLKKYEELHCSHLQEDKLFEVRYHGLPAHKKRELEETLRTFTSSLEQPPDKSEPTPSRAPLSSALVKQPSHVDSLSSTSYSRPADSAYASMFPSGDANVSKIHDEPHRVQVKNPDKRGLDSLVYTVTEGPFGGDQLRKSETVQKKLVVRKLEQLFTGKEPASKACNQPQPPHGAFQAVRKVDRNTKSANGHRVLLEGVREARILPADAESLADGRSDGRVPANLQATNHTGCSSARSRNGDINASSDSSPEQRPTRPLDIDPDRPQVPAENMEYIRHLGFSSSTVDVNATGEDGEGWVYLNLLISMAQLHTINVTPDFVRKAVAEVSDRFELSRDGRKIRWKGGTEGTRMTSDVGSNGDQSNEKSLENLAGRSRKRRRLGNARFDSEPLKPEHELASSPVGMLQQLNEPSADDGHTTKTRRTFRGQVHTHNGLGYKPLFRHATHSEEDESSVQTSNSTTSLGTASDSISVASAANALMNQKLVPDPLEPKYGQGPMIYYQGASFCTDLSGDMSCLSEEPTEFGHRVQNPLGSTRITLGESLIHADNVRRSSRKSQSSPDHMDRGGDRSGAGMADLQFPTLYPTGSDVACDRVVPLEFEASGIGGVQPYDNFAINVHVCHVTSVLEQRDSNAPTSPQEHQHLLFNASCGGTSRKKPPWLDVKGEIVSTVKTDLPPSSLPPPSYYLSLSTSETEDDNETESDSNDSSANDPCNSQMDVELSVPSNSIQVYRTAGSGRPPNMSGRDSEDSNLDADDDPW